MFIIVYVYILYDLIIHECIAGSKIILTPVADGIEWNIGISSMHIHLYNLPFPSL